MMNAEMPSEIIRSRTQAENSPARRTFLGVFSIAGLTCGVSGAAIAVTFYSIRCGFGEGSDSNSISYENRMQIASWPVAKNAFSLRTLRLKLPRVPIGARSCTGELKSPPSMKPVAYTSPYSWIFWAIFLWAYFPEFRLILRSKAHPGDTSDRGSMVIIMMAAWIAYPIAFWLAETPHFRLGHAKFWFFFGLALVVVGSLLRRYCWRALGKFFTGNVTIQQDQTVIQTGPYRWVRHPSYTGGVLMHAGCGVTLGNWMSALVLFVASGAGYLYRVHVEEKALVAGLGEPYREYMQRTKKFVPYVI